jgi:tRNA wybutosine-synthesizing protein 3
MNLPASANNESSLMVGIRSMGVSFDSIIGYRDHSGQLRSVVDEKYVYNMFLVANERFKINFERTKRFQMNVSRIFSNTTTAEERGTRKQRKRAEGLATQHRLRRIIDSEETHDEDDHTAIRDLWD